MTRTTKNILLSLILLLASPSLVSANGMGQAIIEVASLYILWPLIIITTVAIILVFLRRKRLVATESRENFAMGALVILNLLLIATWLSPFLTSFLVNPGEMQLCFLDHYGPRRLCSFYQGTIRGLIFAEFIPIFTLGWIVYSLYFLIRRFIRKNPIPYSNSLIFTSFIVIALVYLVFTLGRYLLLFSSGNL